LNSSRASAFQWTPADWMMPTRFMSAFFPFSPSIFTVSR
jgi:hypothetical protein